MHLFHCKFHHRESQGVAVNVSWKGEKGLGLNQLHCNFTTECARSTFLPPSLTDAHSDDSGVGGGGREMVR